MKCIKEPDSNDVRSECKLFASSQGLLSVGEQKFIIRILKMNDSTMVFLSAAELDVLDEIALALKVPQDNQIIGTYIIGPQIISDSQRLAEKLCKRFGRHFIVSNNIKVDQMIAPLLEKALSEFVRTHEHQFI